MRALVFIAAVLAAAPLLAAKPAAVTSYPPDWPHRAPWKLNRELLLPETERIVFVVDRQRGGAPIPEAMDQFVELAAKYGGRPASWVRLGEPGAPNVQWVEPLPTRKPVKYYVRLHNEQTLSDFHVPQDDVETLRYMAEVPSCPTGALPTTVSYVFVRYLGQLGNAYGNTDTVVSTPSCGGREFHVIRVAQTRIAMVRAPGIGQDFLELRALAHEYGHVLGLASNPEHGMWLSTIPYRGGSHCIHRNCAAAVPTAMALLKGQMFDYCAACVRDIQQAREHWLTGREFPDVPRLPQPDPLAAVRRLKPYNFRDGGEADKLLGYGKAVMPSLVARIAQLQRGYAASPQSYAITLALKIVISEDDARRESGGPAFVARDTTSTEFINWWQHESEPFMAGDDWDLPPMLGVPKP